MNHFSYRNQALYAEDVPVADIAGSFGTPCYVYSRATLERHWRAFDTALGELDHLICYAVKANSNLAILNLLARLGSGFDIVSIGELERVLAAGGNPAKVVFSGVGKRADEIERALDLGIACFNVESESELLRLNAIAGSTGKSAPISLRVNPDVDAKTHPYISTGLRENKFGIAIDDAERIYHLAADLPHLQIHGIDCHIGSQLTDTAPFVDALTRVLKLADRLSDSGIEFQHLDIGGGLGIRYRDETPPEPTEYVHALRSVLGTRPYKILMEPGRAIVGNAGILLTKIEYLKHNADRHFAVIDAAMNDLMRPALYNAWQDIIPVKADAAAEPSRYDVVGPVCETGDFLGKQRELAVAEGDLLAVCSAGAYGFSMSSNYNTRPRAAEVLVDGETVHLIRERESIASLFAHEHCLPD